MQQNPGEDADNDDAADIEKTSSNKPNLSKKLLARDMIAATKQLQKLLEELGEILEEMAKCTAGAPSEDNKDNAISKEAQAELTAKIKFKSQLRDLQQEFSVLKKQFRT